MAKTILLPHRYISAEELAQLRNAGWLVINYTGDLKNGPVILEAYTEQPPATSHDEGGEKG
jgi:hypothetical protein